MKPSVSEYIASSLLVILILGGWYYDHKVSALELELSKVTTKLVASTSSNIALKDKIKQQNIKIKDMALNEKAKAKKAKKELTRLNKIIKDLGKVKSNDCEDIKNTLDAISDYDYNKL